MKFLILQRTYFTNPIAKRKRYSLGTYLAWLAFCPSKDALDQMSNGKIKLDKLDKLLLSFWLGDTQELPHINKDTLSLFDFLDVEIKRKNKTCTLSVTVCIWMKIAFDFNLFITYRKCTHRVFASAWNNYLAVTSHMPSGCDSLTRYESELARLAFRKSTRDP